MRTDGNRLTSRLPVLAVGLGPFLGTVNEFRENAAATNQFIIRARLGDAAVIEDEDAVRVAQRGQPMRYEDDGAIGAGLVDGALHGAFADVVESRCSLIEDEDRRVLQEDTRQRQP